MLVLTLKEGEGFKIFVEGEVIDVYFITQVSGRHAKIGVNANKEKFRVERNRKNEKKVEDETPG